MNFTETTLPNVRALKYGESEHSPFPTNVNPNTNTLRKGSFA